MKKLIVGGLIGSITLFIWQFLSWGLLNFHGSQMEYTPQQDEIIAALNEFNLKEGTYFIPRAPAGASQEEMEAANQKYVGKPWALVSYRNNLQNNMAMNMFRGWASSLVACIFFTWVLLQFNTLNMKNSIMAALGVGLIAYLTIPYLNSIWFEGNTLPDLLDAIVPWVIFGAILGWYLPERKTET